MEFELTPEITDDIIFAMEDQTGHFLFDSALCLCAPSTECEVIEDSDQFYEIPVWDSISGFKMMDRFITQLRNPVVREQLRSALAYGHGVFRNFKNILKSHPEVERLWYLFKEREMRNIVLEWYNSLRDFWGLERIGAEPEETGEIVSQEFMFRPYTPKDMEALNQLLVSIDSETGENLQSELTAAVRNLWARIRGPEDKNEFILVVESAEGDIVGCSISAPIPEESLFTVQMSLIGVFPEFRGLGIGKELLSRTIEHWTDKGFRWFLFTSPLVPPLFVPMLQRMGFVEKGHVSVLELI